MRGECGHDVGGGHECLGWREQRPFAVVPALLEPHLDLCPITRECPLEIDEIDDHAVRRQVVRKTGSAAEKQRKPGFDPGGIWPALTAR